MSDTDSSSVSTDLEAQSDVENTHAHVSAIYVVTVPEEIIEEITNMGHDDAPKRAAKNLALTQFRDDTDFPLLSPSLTVEQLTQHVPEEQRFRVSVVT